MSDVPSRVHGLDLLRGLCATLVALYHVSLWQHTYYFYNFGSYGVYIFFLLSGASMTMAYKRRIEEGLPLPTFLLMRFFRLAPLYWLLIVLHFIYKGEFNVEQLSYAALNATFLFGFANPGHTSAVTGGWSLGIEFVFYFVFPVFLSFLAGKYRPYFIAALLLLLQYGFVSTIARDTDDIENNWITYTQFMSFIGYFFSGCVIGKLLLNNHETNWQAGRFVTWLVFIAALFLIFHTPLTAEAGVTGLRGILLPLICIVAVFFAGHLYIPNWLVPCTSWLGAVSYSLYLIHPVLFNQLIKISTITNYYGPVGFGFVIIAISMVVASAVE